METKQLTNINNNNNNNIIIILLGKQLSQQWKREKQGIMPYYTSIKSVLLSLVWQKNIFGCSIYILEQNNKSKWIL